LMISPSIGSSAHHHHHHHHPRVTQSQPSIGDTH
jgi:hypothetical protein